MRLQLAAGGHSCKEQICLAVPRAAAAASAQSAAETTLPLVPWYMAGTTAMLTLWCPCHALVPMFKQHC